jgi:RNA polymerase sigma factor (sigma-70 family)
MPRLQGSDSGALLHQLGRLFEQGTVVGLTEGELLERFVTGHDESAFTTLVARHGPMVLGVCRPLLQDPNDVDDAFQATFLVLVRKAGMLRRRDLLGNWLYGVAYRVAARARTSAARRTARYSCDPRAVAALADDGNVTASGMSQAAAWDPDPWPGLHQEVSHLPEKYRVPIVLCYFEGLTHDEAALRLGWPLGSVKGRLARARDLLRRRLSRRGVTCSAAAITSHLNAPAVRMAVPSYLELAASRAAQSVLSSAGTSLALGSIVSIPVTAMVEGVLQNIMINQIRSFAFSLFCAGGIVTTGVVLAATQRADEPGHTISAPIGATDLSPAQSPAIGNSNSAEQTVSIAPKDSNPATAEVVEQLRSEHVAFDKLLSHLRDPAIEEIDRLNRWSLLTLQADLVLAATEADQTAVYRAHRDRIKQLYGCVAALPVSPQNKPIKADRAHELLKLAEMLSETRGTGASMAGMSGQMGMGMMSNMMSMMGSRSPGRSAESFPEQKKGKSIKSERPTAEAARDESSPSEPEPTGAGGMMGGMMGGRMGGAGMSGPGGMMGGTAGVPAGNRKSALRKMVAESTVEMAIRDPNPRNRVVFKKLEEPISMSFNEETPLEDVLKYIRQASTTKTYGGIPIYVDPQGLQDANVTMTSTIRNIELESIPLKTTLRLILRQLELAYCVRDGLLFISSYQGIQDELSEARAALDAEEENGGGNDGRAGSDRPKAEGEAPVESTPLKATPKQEAVEPEKAESPREGPAEKTATPKSR